MAKFINIVVFILFCLTGSVQAQSSHFTSERLEVIDAFILERMAIDNIPGVSVVLVENGQIVRHIVKGTTGNNQKPVTPSTIFALGSVSKSFTGLAILKLAEEGRINLDDPVVQHIPWFQTKDKPRSEQITIRHLLNHTSGLSSYDGNTLLTDRLRSASALETSIRRLANVRLIRHPGESFNYSNDNYRILGLLLQILEKMPYEEVIKHQIFTPLNMKTSRFFGIGERNVAIPHRYWFTDLRPHQISLGSSNNPEAGVYANGIDMGAYLIALTGGNQKVPNYWRKTLAEGPTLSSGNRYSIGFESYGPLKEPILIHGGWNAGFMARIGFDPTRRIGVAIMTNTGRGYIAGDIDMLTKGVLARVLGIEAVTAKTFVKERTILGVIIGLFLIISAWITVFLYRLRLKKSESHQTIWQLIYKTILPSMLLGIVSWIIFVILPFTFETTLDGLRLFHPDLGWALTFLASLGLFWALTRPILIWFRLWQ